jgi:hypothetical protein
MISILLQRSYACQESHYLAIPALDLGREISTPAMHIGSGDSPAAPQFIGIAIRVLIVALGHLGRI